MVIANTAINTHKTANLLSEEGLNVVGLPKTIDNDIYGTDFTFGFHSAVDIAKVTPRELVAARNAESQQRVRFQSGLATAVDVTVAEAALAQAESQEAIAQLNVWRAMGAYAAATGDLTAVRAAATHP
jgi:6-phosphofructokinase